MAIDPKRVPEGWKGWTCCDCDPTIAGATDVPYDRPFFMALPEDYPEPDYCPRCESYLSMTEVSRAP